MPYAQVRTRPCREENDSRLIIVDSEVCRNIARLEEELEWVPRESVWMPSPRGWTLQDFDATTYPQLHVDETASTEGGTATISPRVARLRERDVLIEDRLPQMPLRTRTIQVRIESAGRGKPKFKTETGFALFSDNE
jgi:hypothetical protein